MPFWPSGLAAVADDLTDDDEQDSQEEHREADDIRLGRDSSQVGDVDELPEGRPSPETKFVMMKSSKLSEKLSRAAETMPGRTSGKVTRQKVSTGPA